MTDKKCCEAAVKLTCKVAPYSIHGYGYCNVQHDHVSETEFRRRVRHVYAQVDSMFDMSWRAKASRQTISGWLLGTATPAPQYRESVLTMLEDPRYEQIRAAKKTILALTKAPDSSGSGAELPSNGQQ